MNALKALEFLAKHTANRTVTNIAHSAGVDVSNFHACLAGKRTWPKAMVSRIACALGLTATLEPGISLELTPQTVLHIAVNGEELPLLAEAIAVCATANPNWQMRVPYENPPAGSVGALVLGRIQNSYLVVQVTWLSTEAACHGVDQLPTLLPGIWLERNPDVHALSSSSLEWIRLRSALVSIPALDQLFGVQAAPPIEEWAQMLISVSRLGTSPAMLTALARMAANTRLSQTVSD